MMIKEQHIASLAADIHLRCRQSKTMALDLAEFLYDEGYRLECHSSWVYDEYLDDMICNACNGKALGSLTTYCPHCGSVMYMRKG